MLSFQMCRTERQAFGQTYRLNIFNHAPVMYVSRSCRCSDLRELILKCSGHVTNRKCDARYIIMEKYSERAAVAAAANTTADQLNIKLIHSNWIFDCIQAATLLNVGKYVLSQERPFGLVQLPMETQRS